MSLLILNQTHRVIRCTWFWAFRHIVSIQKPQKKMYTSILYIYKCIIYNFLVDVHKPEVIFIIRESKRPTIFLLLKMGWGRGGGLFNAPKYTWIWMLIDFNKIMYRQRLSNTLSPCILNIFMFTNNATINP